MKHRVVPIALCAIMHTLDNDVHNGDRRMEVAEDTDDGRCGVSWRGIGELRRRTAFFN